MDGAREYLHIIDFRLNSPLLLQSSPKMAPTTQSVRVSVKDYGLVAELPIAIASSSYTFSNRLATVFQLMTFQMALKYSTLRFWYWR